VTRLATMDLFAGCGGLSLGLAQAGLDIRWANEHDKHAAATYRQTHPSARLFEEGVDTFFARLRDGGDNLPLPGDVDLVAGGPPCQGFSGYNPFKHPADPRNSLVERFLDIVAYLRPRYVLMENVTGLLAMEGGAVVQALVAGLEKLGFGTRMGIVQCGNFGVPQSRWRVFIWAATAGLAVPKFSVPTHMFPRKTVFGATRFRDRMVSPPSAGPDLFWNPMPTVTVGDAISDLPAIENGGGLDDAEYESKPLSEFQREARRGSRRLFDHRCSTLRDLMYARCQAVPKKPGAGWLDLPEELKPLNLIRHGDDRYPNRFGRLHWGGTFNTILTRAFPYWGAVFHPEQDRVLSVRESARAQGFPDVVNFLGPLSRRYVQVGNAVPPPVARMLAEELLIATSEVVVGT